MQALTEFARLELSLDELLHRMRGLLEIDFGRRERRLNSHFICPDPGIRIERRYIENALEKYRQGEITVAQIRDWATMLLLNVAYDWSGTDEDEITDLLTGLSWKRD